MVAPIYYQHFCAVIASKPDIDHRDCIVAVMRASGSQADPNVVSDWWHMWQMLRDSKKAALQDLVNEIERLRQENETLKRDMGALLWTKP